jgi:hypothetical protein
MAGRHVRLALFSIAFLLLSARAGAAESVRSILDVNSRTPNPFSGYDIPAREILREHSPYWEAVLRHRRYDGAGPYDCTTELHQLYDGFKALYPNFPDPIGQLNAWSVHVTMVRFRALTMCSIREEVREALREIDALGLKIEPFPQHVSYLNVDVEMLINRPKPLRALSSAIADLIWMSYKGYAPAMFELAKLSARDDVIRLTPRFAYYLLAVSDRAGLTDPAVPRLLAIARQNLNADDRAEIEQRVARRRWPKTERMVID